MRDVLDRIERWVGEGKKVAVATLIATERSSPRDPGAVLAVTEDMEMTGSVTAGCVEAAVAEEAAEVIRTGRPKRLTYGIADEEAFAVGLSCGGVVHLFAAPFVMDEITRALAGAIRAGDPVALATEVSGPHPGARMLIAPGRMTGALSDPVLEAAVTRDARAMLDQAETGVRRYGGHGHEMEAGQARQAAEAEVFIESFAPPPRMYLFGATTHAAAASRLGKFLGYRVTVCDARAALAIPERFPDAAEVAVVWPDEFLSHAPVDRRTVICVLTHDPKFDVPLLAAALRTSAGYIGALGSRRTHEARCRKLLAAGVPQEALGRIRAPIGLDLGGRTPEEVAVAIAAEIVALRSGRQGEGRAAAGRAV